VRPQKEALTVTHNQPNRQIAAITTETIRKMTRRYVF
jgi:hypothetical protein